MTRQCSMALFAGRSEISVRRYRESTNVKVYALGRADLGPKILTFRDFFKNNHIFSKKCDYFMGISRGIQSHFPQKM